LKIVGIRRGRGRDSGRFWLGSPNPFLAPAEVAHAKGQDQIDKPSIAYGPRVMGARAIQLFSGRLFAFPLNCRQHPFQVYFEQLLLIVLKTERDGVTDALLQYPLLFLQRL
jgi:hypothetical protein